MNELGVRHIIITRFNLIVNKSEPVPKNLSDDWLDQRFKLFSSFCFPSVKNQTNQNFQWFVFFAHNTPEKFRVIINRCAEEFDRFVPVFTDKPAYKAATYLSEIEKSLVVSDRVLITTRLDSDDALGRDFVRNIQSAQCDEDDYFIYFSFGNQYDLINKLLVSVKNDSNPFLTRVETKSECCDFKTVFAVESHNSVESSKRIILKNKNMWLQVIHNSNILNSLSRRGLPVVWTRNFSGKFSLAALMFDLKNNVSRYFRYVIKSFVS